jgi:hypothetical protein
VVRRSLRRLRRFFGPNGAAFAFLRWQESCSVNSKEKSGHQAGDRSTTQSGNSPPSRVAVLHEASFRTGWRGALWGEHPMLRRAWQARWPRGIPGANLRNTRNCLYRPVRQCCLVPEPWEPDYKSYDAIRSRTGTDSRGLCSGGWVLSSGWLSGVEKDSPASPPLPISPSKGRAP